MGKIGPYGPPLAPRAWPVWEALRHDAATPSSDVGDAGRADSSGGASPRPRPRLIVGNYDAAQSRAVLREHRVRAVVTVAGDVEPPLLPKPLPWRQFAVAEGDAAVMIHLMPELVQAIQESLDGADADGAVLVHSAHGQSRAPCAVAVYLMQARGFTADDALAVVQASVPEAAIGDALQEQLRLYEAMKCKLDMNNQLYRRLRMETMLLERQAEGVVGTTVYGSDPVVVQASTAHLRCRKCRRPLFEAQHIVEHTPGVGQAAFSWRKQNSSAHGKGGGAPVCASYFVEPMAWMEGVDDPYTLEGKIQCPKCASKLGTFSWPGSQCSCGAWVAPAFVIHKKNVDPINMPR